MSKIAKGIVVALALAGSTVAFAQQNVQQVPQQQAVAPAPYGVPGYGPYGVPGYGPYGVPYAAPYAYGPYYGPGYYGGPWGNGWGRGNGRMAFSFDGSGWGNGHNGWW
jgi:hypothetical protein